MALAFMAGCAQLEQMVPKPAGDMPDEAARPDNAPPPDARTVDEFDTTTEAERAAAKSGGSAGGGSLLGTSIAALGSASKPGIWVKTPLVSTETRGRVEYPEKGTSAMVDLLPLDGDVSAGSQLSLATMRVLEAPLTGLPEVKIYKVE